MTPMVGTYAMAAKTILVGKALLHNNKGFGPPRNNRVSSDASDAAYPGNICEIRKFEPCDDVKDGQ